jgi:membrane protease YdiL (CAAX protease family)
MKTSKKLSLIALAFIVMSLAITTAVSAYDDWPYDTTTDEEAAAFLFGYSLVCCFVMFIPWIIWLILGIWVYKDAEKRGKSGILWFLIVFVLGIIGLIIWLVVRPPIGGEQKQQSSGRMCPNCGRPIPMDAQVCPYCGKNFNQP